MGRRTGDTPAQDLEADRAPALADELAPALAQGSEIHDREILQRQVAVDQMLIAYLRDQEIVAPAMVELVLYVVDSSESCDKARRTVERVVARYAPGEVSVSVRNLTVAASMFDDFDVKAVPTLVMRKPRVVFLDRAMVDDGSSLHDLLRLAGLRRQL